MQIIAHRGWSERFPENTHAAFSAAVTTGCQGIELDLRLSCDGVVVVAHDASLAAYGGARRPISQQTLAELRQQCPVATLAEVLDRYRSVELLLELKPHAGPAWTRQLLAAVCAQIRARAVRERVMLLCFQARVLQAAKLAVPRVRVVRNCELIPRANATAWFAQHAYCHAIDAHFSAWDPTLVALARAQGLRTSAYTVNRVPELRRCHQLGLDLVITNRPLFARLWLGRQGLGRQGLGRQGLGRQGPSSQELHHHDQ